MTGSALAGQGTLSARLLRAVCWLWLGSSLAASPGEAELVLLVGGGILKVNGFERSGDRVSLRLPAGGELTLSVLRIDRILADEIERNSAVDFPRDDLRIEFGAGTRVPDTPFGDLIFTIARQHSINPTLIAAMVGTESAFDPYAVSRKGAAGLLQLMPSTAARFGISEVEVFDPERNLDAGVRYVRWLSDRFAGDVTLVLAGYNAGEAAVERHGGVPPYAETRDYIRKVYSAAGSLPAGAERE